LVPNVPPILYSLVVNIFVSTLGLHADPTAIVAEYPITNYQSDVRIALSAIGTDVLFSCSQRRTDQDLSRFVSTHAYEFNDPNAPTILAPPGNFPYHSYHASELPYLFDSATRGGHAPLTPDQEKLAAAMVSYWTRFAGAGDPNSPATPSWPAYTIANDTFQSLAPPTPQPTTGFAADHKCAFWDA